MNSRQRKVLLFGIALLIAAVLCPPWLYYDGSTSNQASAGYYPFFNPPPVTTYLQMFGQSDDDVLSTRFVRVQLNGIRLTVQILGLAFLTTGLMLRLRKQRLGSPSGCFMTLGIATICLYVLLVLSKKY